MPATAIQSYSVDCIKQAQFAAHSEPSDLLRNSLVDTDDPDVMYNCFNEYNIAPFSLNMGGTFDANYTTLTIDKVNDCYAPAVLLRHTPIMCNTPAL